MNKTEIEWVKNPDGSQGYTWNPITGCLNHVNGMCKGGYFPCYAYRLATTRLRKRYLANKNVSHTYFPNYETALDDAFYPRFWEERLLDIPYSVKPKGIFVCDMSDLLGIGIPYWWTKSVLDMTLMHPDCRFYLLTKQAHRLPAFSPFPENVWCGVTVTDGDMLRKALYHLACVEAKVKYISFEPLLNSVMDYAGQHTDYPSRYLFNEVRWVIIGAQTKPYKPPKIEWVREIVQACDKAGVKVFLKDNLIPLMNEQKGMDSIKGMVAEINAFAGVQRLRQEMP